MKKFMAISLALVLVFTLAACGGSGGGSGSIVGTWESYDSGSELTFKSDGTYSEIFHGDILRAGTYTLDGDKMTMKETEGANAGKESEWTIELDGDDLTFIDGLLTYSYRKM